MSVAIVWFVDTGAGSTEPAAASGSTEAVAKPDVISIGSAADAAAVGSIGSTAQAARNPALASITATPRSRTRFGRLFRISASWWLPALLPRDAWSTTKQRGPPSAALNTKLCCGETPPRRLDDRQTAGESVRPGKEHLTLPYVRRVIRELTARSVNEKGKTAMGEWRRSTIDPLTDPLAPEVIAAFEAAQRAGLSSRECYLAGVDV
jgi:hypothetical protein